MKGIAVWMWLIAGVVVGMIMFMLFFQLMGYLALSKAREDAKQSFEDLTATVNAMCEGKSGIQSSKNLVFPDSVSVVYSTADPKEYVEKSNRTYGKYACLKFQKEQYCENLRCELEFQPLKSKKNVLGIVDTLLGRSGYQEYFVKLMKTECGMSVLKKSENPILTCTFKPLPLMKCENSVILGLASPQVLVLTDMARIDDCCSGNDKIIKLFSNAATYFKGKRILIVWELDLYDPSNQTRLPIINSLTGLGFSVTPLRHTSELTSDVLKNYDQLWLYRPGWCIPQIKACGGSRIWTDSEINAVGNFVANGGNAFLFAETSGGVTEDQAIVNKILKIARTNSQVDGTTVCGYGSNTVPITDIAKHPITDGLNSFDITAAAKVNL